MYTFSAIERVGDVHLRIYGRVFFVCLVLSAISGCGGSEAAPPSHPGPTAPTPVPTEPSINIAGNWVGTLDSSLGSQTITMTVVQLANCVDGTWISSGQSSRGAISGFAGKDSFTGQLSFESGQCSAIGDITGEVGAETLRWTGRVTSLGPCAQPLPQSIVVTMRRQ
jgi:hypothetical protein